MGTVYKAVRDDDAFPKTVAIKLVRSGRGSDYIEQRFRQERRILARLQHPNIATVLDGGTTGDGQPYLVMEHVEGQPITEFCAAQALGTRARLALFRTVCSAVHYAHQNLVVHRDIKPANVLVDGQGVPKLLDFGIAKLLASGVDPDVAPTATMLPMMTPEYASPEQVKGQAVTTASDVYSLGVLLYELLAGRRPYEVETESLEAIVQAVCGTDPRAPSDSIDEPTSKSPRPFRTPPLASELRGDLDTIVLKALRKEPERRYPSAHELSEDLRRHLDGLPVAARADSIGYRAGKFARRHRTAVAAAVLVSASLVGGIVATIRQARIAEANRSRAERRFADVRKLANSFLFDVHDEIRELPGSTRARQRLVATAQEYLDSLAREAQDTGLQRELAAAYERLGDVQGGALNANLGDMPGALESYRKAAAIHESLASTRAPGARDDIDLPRLQLRRGTLLRGMGRLGEAESLFRDVAERIEASLAAGDAPEDAQRNLLVAYAKWAEVQTALGGVAEARRPLQKAIQHGEGFTRDHPEDASAHLNLANSYYFASLDAGNRGEHRQALDYVRRARTIQEALHQQEALNQSYVRGLLFSLNGEGLHLRNLGQREEAVQIYRHALEVAQDMLRRDPQDRWAQTSVTVAYSALGKGLIDAGDPVAALVVLRKGREIAARLVSEDPANGFVLNELAVIDANIGVELLATRSPAALREGCRALARSVESWQQLKAQGPLTGNSATGMQRIETEMVRCRRASTQ